MRRMRSVVQLGLAGLLLAGLASLAACRVRDDGNAGRTDGGQLPQLVGGANGQGDAAAATKIGTIGQGGGTHLVLDLTKQPDNTAASLWACWPVPPASYALGRAVCASDQTKVVELTAANADAACASNPSFQTVAAATPLSLDGCAAYDVYEYKFDPPLTLVVK